MHSWYHYYYLLTIIPSTSNDINKLKCITTTYDIICINHSQDKRYLESVICSWTIPLSINCGWSQKTCFFIYTETETRVHICYFDLYLFTSSSRTDLHATLFLSITKRGRCVFTKIYSSARSDLSLVGLDCRQVACFTTRKKFHSCRAVPSRLALQACQVQTWST